MTDIGPAGAIESQVNGMSATRFAAGSWGTGTNDDGFLYDLDTGVLTDLKNPLSASWSCVASGVNDLGQVVGGYALDATFDAATAFIYTSAGGMQDLNDLIDPSSGYYLQSAAAINNSGEIVGQGFNAAGQADAYLLTPVPEPSMFSLLCATILGFPTISFGARQRRPNSFCRNTLAMWRAVIGRTGTTRKLKLLGAGVKLLIAVCAAVAQAYGGTIEYTVADLGTLGGPTSAAWAISQNGIIVGNSELYVAGSSGVVRENHPCIFQANGQIQDLGLLDPVNGVSGQATSVNCQGQVVGSTDSPGIDRPANAFLYNAGGPLIDLGTPGQESLAYGINASGQIAGYGFQSYAAPPYGLLWTVSGTTVSTVNLGTGFLGLAINDHGLIGGFDPQTQHAAIYNTSSGSMTDIGPAGATESQVNGMSGSRFVTGTWGTATTGDGFLYDLNTGVLTDLKDPVSPSLGCTAYGVNDYGVVVGGYLIDANNDGVAFIYSQAKGMQNLNDLIDPSSGFYVQCAMAINNSGEIVGEGFNAAGQNDAFLLTPVPEPSALQLAMMALTILVTRLGWVHRAKKT
jgi:probable HAF family extracellular repeat protein